MFRFWRFLHFPLISNNQQPYSFAKNVWGFYASILFYNRLSLACTPKNNITHAGCQKEKLLATVTPPDPCTTFAPRDYVIITLRHLYVAPVLRDLRVSATKKKNNMVNMLPFKTKKAKVENSKFFNKKGGLCKKGFEWKGGKKQKREGWREKGKWEGCREKNRGKNSQLTAWIRPACTRAKARFVGGNESPRNVTLPPTRKPTPTVTPISTLFKTKTEKIKKNKTSELRNRQNHTNMQKKGRREQLQPVISRP